MSTSGGERTERGDLDREASPLPHYCSRSNPLSSLLGRLLDDFMPHKNDIKFVKTVRCNDRTAWPYGVGAKGVSRGRKENARASGERKGRTADTSSKRNRNREQPQGTVLDGNRYDSFVPRINSGWFDECGNTRVKQCMLPFVRTWSKCDRERLPSMLRTWKYQNYFGVIMGQRVLFALTFVRITGEKIPPEDKLSARRIDTFYNRDR